MSTPAYVELTKPPGILRQLPVAIGFWGVASHPVNPTVGGGHCQHELLLLVLPCPVAIGFCLFLPLKSLRQNTAQNPILWHAQPPNPTARPTPPILRQLAVAIGFCLFLPLKSFRKNTAQNPILWHAQTPQSYGAPRRQNPTATGSCHRILPFSAFKII